MHLENKNKELNKLLIFLAVNYDAPFTVKKRVVDAAFMSSILYGCESWLNISLKPVEKVYLSAIKSLLGVRTTATNQLCLLEGGFKPLVGLVKDRQKKFFDKMASRTPHHRDPFSHAMEIVNSLNKPMSNYITSIKEGSNFALTELQVIKDFVSSASGTKFQTYVQLNPDLAVHALYSPSAPVLPDYFTYESHFLGIDFQVIDYVLRLGVIKGLHMIIVCALVGWELKMNNIFLFVHELKNF